MAFSVRELSDGRLTDLVREGQDDAYAELYRRHSGTAVRYARRFVPASDAHDVAQESFLKVLRALRGDHGPREEFLGYLLRTVRNMLTDRSRRTEAVPMEPVEIEDAHGEESPDHAPALVERDLLAQAFSSLPDQWQRVLWLTEVEGRAPRELVPDVAASPNAVAQLSRRAREGLRGAWLQAHVQTHDADAGCRETLAVLADYDRGRLAASKAARVDAHLVGCASCTEILADLRQISVRIPVLLLPVVLGAGTFADGAFVGVPGFLGAGGGTGADIGGPLTAARRTTSHTTAVGVSSVAVGVVLAAAAAVGLTGLWAGDDAGPTLSGTEVASRDLEMRPASPSASPSPSPSPSASPSPSPASPTPSPESVPAASPSPTLPAVPPPDAPSALPAPVVEPAPAATAPPSGTGQPVGTPVEPAASASPPAPPTAPTPSPTPTPTPTPTPSPTPTPTPTPTPSPPVVPEAPTIDGPDPGPFRLPVALTGDALPGATVTVSDQAGETVATTTADDTGAWQVVPPAGTVDVPTSYTATQSVDGATSEGGGPVGPYVFEAPAVLRPGDGETVDVLPGNLVPFDLQVPAGTPYEVTFDGETTSFPALETDSTLSYFFGDLEAGVHEITTQFMGPDGVGALRRVTFVVP